MLPIDLGFLNLPSYIVGIVTGVVGVWIIFMIATYKARKVQASMLESILQHVGEHMSDAQNSAEQGNYGSAAASAKQGLNELQGLKDEMALTEIMDSDKKEAS